MEEIELQDGAGAEFDMELVSKGRTVAGIFRIRTDQLRCGDIPSAFPAHDYITASEKIRCRALSIQWRSRFFCICI